MPDTLRLPDAAVEAAALPAFAESSAPLLSSLFPVVSEAVCAVVVGCGFVKSCAEVVL